MTMHAPSWPGVAVDLFGLMIGRPSVSTLASGAIVAVATTHTSEMRSPAKIVGSASGSSTLRMICGLGQPDRRAPRRRVSRSTPRTPT